MKCCVIHIHRLPKNSSEETMAMSDELTVMGYLRSICKNKSIIPKDIVNVISKFYLFPLNSAILTSVERNYLFDMLVEAIPDLDGDKYEFILLYHNAPKHRGEKDAFDVSINLQHLQLRIVNIKIKFLVDSPK